MYNIVLYKHKIIRFKSNTLPKMLLNLIPHYIYMQIYNKRSVPQ